MMYPAAIIISALQGFFLLNCLFPKTARPRPGLLIFWSLLAGLGLSSAVTFSSLVIFNKLFIPYVIAANLLTTGLLMTLSWKNTPLLALSPARWDNNDIIGLVILLILNISVILQAILYPQGGWDAWSCWNLKARFIFLGGENWRNMMDPVLWRSNIAYPLLLPLFNTWIWCFGSTPTWTIPLFTSCYVTFIMSGLLYFGLRELGGKLTSILAPAWTLSIAFFITLAASQYSDLLVGVWLLSSALAFKLAYERISAPYFLLCAISLGLMSFTKSEGLMLAVLAAGFYGSAFLFKDTCRAFILRHWLFLAVTFILAFLPTIIFQLTMAPDSHTFINGLTSTEKPVSMDRLKATAMFFGIEFMHPKWNGLWMILAAGAVLSGRKALSRGLWVVPATFASYLVILCGVYTVNTFFSIMWWLSTTLNRLLFALVPALIFWLFCSLDQNSGKK